MPEFLVDIGGATVSILLPGRYARLEPAYRPFLQASRGKPEAGWRVNPDPFPRNLAATPPSPPPFPLWEIERGESQRLFRFRKRLDSPELWKAARTAPSVSRGEIWTDRSRDSRTYPLRGIDQLLFAHFLLSRGGLIVHAAAAEVAGRGCLFPGPGGAGKSTWAKLLGGVPGLTVLGEDKVILRGSADGLRILGTPWNPEPASRVAGSAKLAGIYFLDHSRENAIQPLEPFAALRQLLGQTFLPFSAPELDEAVSVLEEAVRAAETFSFGFRAERSAVEYFRDAVERRPGEDTG